MVEEILSQKKNNILDFFSETIDVIINQFNISNFIESDYQMAKFSYDSIKWFHYIDCYEEEHFHVYYKVDIETIQKYVEYNLNPLILARYYTYMYMNFSDNKFINAKKALEYYILAYDHCVDYEYKCSCLNKMISISRKFKIRDYNDKICKLLLQLFDVNRTEHNAFDYHVVQVAYDYDVIGYETCISRCKEKMNDHHKCGSFMTDAYFELAVTAYEKAYKNKFIDIETRNKGISDLHLLKSNLNEEFADNLSNPIQQSHFYEIALKSLKDVNVDPYSIEFQKLRNKLEKSQRAIKDNMGVFKEKLDFSEYIENIKKNLSILEEDKYIELLIFAGFQPSKKRQIDQVEMIMKKSVTASFFPVATINEEGKNISKLRSIESAKTEKDRNEVILEHAYDSVKMHARIYGQLVQLLIVLIKEKCPDISKYIDEVVNKSYIVPSSRKCIVIKGLKYGLELDLESALGILIPQMENCIRELAGMCGEFRYKIGNDFIESANGLEFLLKDENILAQTIDEDILFGMNSIFISEFGLNYRNKFAHGLIESFNKFDDLYVWWFCLFLIGLYS